MTALIKTKGVFVDGKEALELHLHDCPSLNGNVLTDPYEYLSSHSVEEWIRDTIATDPKEVKVADCFKKQTERKRGRHHKNRKTAMTPPKEARFFRVKLEDTDGPSIWMQAWPRPDGRFVGWVVHQNGTYEERRIGRDVYRTFLELDPKDVKWKERAVLCLDQKKLVRPTEATRLTNLDARETGQKSKRDAYVQKKRAKRAERARAKAAKAPKPKPTPEAAQTDAAPTVAKATRKVRRRPTGGFIVSAGVNGESGTETRVLDAWHEDSDVDGEHRWVLECVDHGTLQFLEQKREAKKLRAHPKSDGWCAKCKGAK